MLRVSLEPKRLEADCVNKGFVEVNSDIFRYYQLTLRFSSHCHIISAGIKCAIAHSTAMTYWSNPVRPDFSRLISPLSSASLSLYLQQLTYWYHKYVWRNNYSQVGFPSLLTPSLS